MDLDAVRHCYVTHEKEPGLRGSLRDFLFRRTKEVEALAGVSFQVARGEMVGLLGPNGAGKSTLMKVLVGLMKPTSGRVRVLGFEPYRKERAFLRDVGLVLGQKSQLSWDLPPSESLALIKEIYGISAPDFRSRLSFLLEALRIGSLLNTPVRKLSLGERMKFELVAALLHRPALLLLDEPTVGLDIPSQYAIRNFLLQVNREFQTTVVVSSHYARDIEELAERLIILTEGAIRYDGSLAALVRSNGDARVLRVRSSTDPSSGRFTFLAVDQHLWECDVAPALVNEAVASVVGAGTVESVTLEVRPLEEVLFGMFSTESPKTGDR